MLQCSSDKMAVGAAVALALLAAGAALAQRRARDLKYEATAIQHELNATSFYPLVHFAIPDGQCTGVVDSDVIPSWCLGVNGISLIARDRAPLRLDIMNDLQSAVVYRQENSDGVCAGIAAVKAKVSCRDLAADTPSYIRSSASGQNWPEPVKKPDANQKVNQAISTEKPPEPLHRRNDLHSLTNKGQDRPETARKPLRPLQYNHDLNSHEIEGQNWQESAKLQPVPLELGHIFDFNLRSGHSKYWQDSSKNEPVRKPLRGGYDLES